MELQLKPHKGNTYPLTGILIKSPSPAVWLREIQAMGISLSTLAVYPLPSTTPNSVWGCLVTGFDKKNIHSTGRNNYCQCVGDRLYIPEHAVLYPATTEAELSKLLARNKYILHPDFGFVELEEEIQWDELIESIVQKQPTLVSPAHGIHIPQEVRSFQVKPVVSEKAIENLEKNIFPQSKELEDKPLSLAEKVKLQMLRTLFKAKDKDARGETTAREKTELMNMMESVRSFFGGSANSSWQDELRAEYEDLEQRNKEQLQKLMDMFRDNPDEALKYAIPLDDNHSTRGGESKAPLNFSKLRWDFSLFNGLNFSGGGGSGTSTIDMDSYLQLRQQYQKTAQDLLDKKEYHKAAFVYMKLLKDYTLAAQALEKGEFYQEAAAIYLNYAKNKNAAATCYEKGRMFNEAVELYKELGQNEKAGDLYLQMNRRTEALEQYQIVVNGFITVGQYLKASLICRNKMEQYRQAQSLLMEGWRTNRDAFNCLNNYFANIPDEKILGEEITRVYRQELTNTNSELFLTVLQHEFNKKNNLADMIRNIAYELIALHAVRSPEIASNLRNFNPNDKIITKDILRYRQQRQSNNTSAATN